MTNNGASTTKTITTPASGQDHDHNPPPPRRDADPLNLAPHSVEAEEAVLGSILMNPEALYEVRAFLTDMDFFMLRNGWIYEALCRLADRDDAIDTRTLAEELRTQGRLDDIGGEAYLNYLPNTMPTALHAEVYGHLVERASLRRRLLGAAGEIAQLAHDQERDTYEIMDEAQSKIFSFARADTGTKKTFAQAANDKYNRLRDIREGRVKPYVVDSPWPDLNKIIPGLEPGTLYITGRQKKGKSIMALQWSLYAAKKKLRVHIVSLEMTIDQIMSRIIAQECGITIEQQNAMSDAQHERLVEWFDSSIKDTPNDLSTLSFDDGMNQTITQIASQARNMKRDDDLDILVIDQISLIKADQRYQNETYKLASFAADLQLLSIQLNIPIIIAAQLKRDDTNSRPTPEHIADTDSIGRFAAGVVAIHDPHHGTDKENTTRELIVMLQRQGESTGMTQVIPMAFRGPLFRIDQLTLPHQVKRQPRPGGVGYNNSRSHPHQEDGFGSYDDK